MTHENLKKLFLCESEAKELIEEAKKHNEILKSKAKADAKKMCMSAKQENDAILARLEVQVEEKIRETEVQVKASFDELVKELDNVFCDSEKLKRKMIQSITLSGDEEDLL